MITEKEIIEKLKTVLGYDAPEITQEQFDNMIDYIIGHETKGDGNPKELIWRLCGCYEYLNFNKVIDIFVDSKDAYYTSELVCYVDGNLDQEYLVRKMIETNDLKFIDEAMSNAGNAMMYSLDEKYLNDIRNFYNREISKRKDEKYK